jgi:CheY-like chemotaxis protein
MSSAARRALVVDDSRSARVILSRLLELYGMQVDTAESGEQALEYLSGARPDVIFMDHLMPGMDGFEAVRAIKSDSRMQTIPVMMYSSQDGPEYLREAMTCGAVGVLPKTLTQTDVSRALYQLHLLPDRREGHPPPRVEETPPAPRTPHTPPGRSEVFTRQPERVREPVSTPPEVRAAVASMLKTYDDDLRQALHSEFEAMTQRLLESQRATLSSDSASSRESPATHSPATSAPWMTTAPAASSRSAWWVVAMMVVGLGVLSWYALQQQRLQTQLEKNNAQMVATLQEQQQQIEALRSELLERSAAPAIETLQVPYGEAPFAGARVIAVRDRILALQTAGFTGTVQIDSYVGDFCLSGSAVTGFTPARADLSIRRCDVIGNPFEDGLKDGAHQSSEFTNMLSMVTRNGTLPPQVKVSNSGHMPTLAYPSQTGPQSDALTAGEWNKIAALNNRVEITLLQQTAL